MSTFDLSSARIRDARATRNAMLRRPRTAVMRHVAHGLVILGLGLAIGLLTATYEIGRQERAARVTR